MKYTVMGLILGLTICGVCAKGVTWESAIKDPAVRDFREAVYSSFTDVSDALYKFDHRTSELERKVAGMQKQITLLHSKKADK